MKVWRAMSREEYGNWKVEGVRGLFVKNGKMKKFVWFATDYKYIETIFARDMYNNRIVSEAYNVIVEFDLIPCNEIPVKLKLENGYVNIGIHNKYMDKIELREINVEFFDTIPKTTNYFFVYQTKDGKMKKVASGRMLKQLWKYWNGFDKRAWFIRADYYEKMLKRFGGVISVKDPR